MNDGLFKTYAPIEIPANWRRDKIARICDFIGSGGTPSTSNPEYYDGDIPWVQTGDLEDSWLNETSKSITEAGLRESSTRCYPEETILVAMYGATIGKLGILNISASVNQACCALVVRKIISVRFMFYILLSMRAELVADGRGGGQQNISQETIKQKYIVYPLLNEQNRIAAYLDASCAAIDAAVAAKRKQLETLDTLRKATIQRIVTRGLVENPTLKQTGNIWLEEIPIDWDLKMLKRLCVVQTGVTLGKVYEGRLIERPYLRVANVQDGHLDLDDVSLIEVPPEVAERVTLRTGDVLMTEGGDLDKLGRGYVWNGEIDFCLHQNHIFAVRCLPYKLLPKFLAYVTASQYGRDYFEATGKRTTNLASTNGTKVGALPIPLPCLKEQKALVEYLDTEVERIKSIQAVLQKQIDTLTAYRKSLIHECVTGQRRISEADLARLAHNT